MLWLAMTAMHIKGKKTPRTPRKLLPALTLMAVSVGGRAGTCQGVTGPAAA